MKAEAMQQAAAEAKRKADQAKKSLEAKKLPVMFCPASGKAVVQKTAAKSLMGMENILH